MQPRQPLTRYCAKNTTHKRLQRGYASHPGSAPVAFAGYVMNANIIFVPAERVVKPVGDIGQRRRSCQRVANMRVRYLRIPLEWTAALLAQSKAECVLTSA